MKPTKIFFILVLITFKNCQVMDEKHQRREIIKDYIKSYNENNIEGMLTHLHQDIVFENYSDGVLSHRTEGKEAFKEKTESAKACFESREQKLEVWNFSDDEVKVNISYNTVLATDLPNGMKKGDTLQLQGVSKFYFRDGKIAKIVDES